MNILKDNSKNKKILKKIFFALPIFLVIFLIVLTPFIIPTHIINAQELNNSTSTNNSPGFFGTIGNGITTGLRVINNAANTLVFGWADKLIYKTVAEVCYGLSFLFAYIFSTIIGIEAWFIGSVLNMNSTVFNTPVVQMGYSVSLSLANLGFIIGIIVIAIATILQNQTYGMKQLLWKVVFMAILINFGLVIMSAIFNTSNQFTNYFLNCIDPSSGGCSGTQSGLTSTYNFATNLAGAFNPQKDFMTNYNDSSLGDSYSDLMIPIFSMIYTIASILLIVIVLASFLVMLVIRYVYIAILAVLLPFAWMLWIFPSTKSNFSDWWKKFIQWTIFAPIVLFFMWLAIETSKAMSLGTGKGSFAQYTSPSNPLWVIISNHFSSMFSPIIQNSLNEIVILGLMVGGLMAAQKLSITGAKETMGMMQKAGGAIKSKAMGGLKRGLKKGASSAISKKFNVPFTKGRKSFSGTGIINKMSKSNNPILSSAGRSLDASKDKNNKKIMDEATKLAGTKNSATIANELQGSMSEDKRLGYIKTLADRGDLDKVKSVGDKSLSEYIDGNSNLLEQYGQQGIGRDYDLATASNSTMRQAQKQINHGFGDSKVTINGKDYKTAKDALNEGANEFVNGLKGQDSSKINTKMAFSGSHKETESAVLEKMSPGILIGMTKNMTGAQKENVLGKYNGILTQKLNILESKNKEELDALDKEIQAKNDNIKKLNNSAEASRKLFGAEDRVKELNDNIKKEEFELNGKLQLKANLFKKNNEDFDINKTKKALDTLKKGMDFQALGGYIPEGDVEKK